MIATHNEDGNPAFVNVSVKLEMNFQNSVSSSFVFTCFIEQNQAFYSEVQLSDRLR